MVKLPDTILKGMKDRIGSSKTARMQDVINEFWMAGYGESKLRKWIRAYIQIGVLERETDSESGDTIVHCIWW